MTTWMPCSFCRMSLTAPSGRVGRGLTARIPEGRYWGPSTSLVDHQQAWIDPAQRLRAPDTPMPKRLEAWLTRTALAITEATLSGLSGRRRFRGANLLRGPAAWACVLSMACAKWGDEHDMSTILDDTPLEAEADRSTASDLTARVALLSLDLAGFLQTWADV